MNAPTGPHWTTSQSERHDWACAQRGWFRRVEGLRASSTPKMRLGTAWHAWQEALHAYWRRNDGAAPADPVGNRCLACDGTGRVPTADGQGVLVGPGDACPPCKGTGHSALLRFEQAEDAAARAAGSQDYDAAAGARQALADLVEVWFVTRGGGAQDPRLRIAAVEGKVYREVRHPDGRPYRPDVLAVPDPSAAFGYRLAATGEARQAGARVVNWPWYVVGVLDALYVSKTAHPSAVVGEWKVTDSPSSLIAALGVDPQTSTYAWLVDQPSVLAAIGAERVGGVTVEAMYGGGIYDPAPLKAGGLSVARNRTVPSWRFQAAQARVIASSGIVTDPTGEHVAWLRVNVDPKLRVAEPLGLYTPEIGARVAMEWWAFVAALTAHRRTAARAPSPAHAQALMPRTAICRIGGCPFRGPCVADGPEARRNFEAAPPADDPGGYTLDVDGPG